MGFYAERIFPWVMDATEPKEMAVQRAIALRHAAGEVLEVGLGTGANLPFYPPEVKTIYAVEPILGMRKRALRRARAAGRNVEWFSSREGVLPFGDDRFDSVVTTDVLCTAGDARQLLREAFRVLRPGGRYFFLEHGLARDSALRKWQRIFNGATRIAACGCELVRNIDSLIRESDFVVESLDPVEPFSGFNALFLHVRGVAVKPARPTAAEGR
jgi:ubiquinone/menaquinone biosynthesis C-methylase UbiE